MLKNENTTEINQSVLYLLCSFIAFKINKDKVKQINSQGHIGILGQVLWIWSQTYTEVTLVKC